MNRADTLALLVHELRSPVAALAAIADTLSARRGEVDPVDARRLLRLAVDAAHDIERIVVDATPGSLRCESVDPAGMIEDAVEGARLSGAPVRLDVVRDLPVLYADPVRLRQALANLVANAAAHSPPDMEVVVAATEVENWVLIEVTDHGEGIASADQARIFEPGFRLSDRPGQGIGLAVARAVAEAHGGALEVVSAPGEGATFTLVLPVGGGTAA